jgi:hypothetical protein
MDAGEFNVVKCDSVSIVILTNLPLSSANNSPLCVLFCYPYCAVDCKEKLMHVAAVKACVGAKFALAVSEKIFF